MPSDVMLIVIMKEALMSFMLSVIIKPHAMSDIILSDIMVIVIMKRNLLYVLYAEYHN
jgi:hypothetical protein